ncbi:MAG: hypothetical protein ACYTEX_11085 [Planctomycetota bacterium]|jgi:hypothetical protein
MKNLWLAIAEGIRYYPCVCPRGWWKQWPFLPLPSWKFIEWRLDTAYGMKCNWPRPPLRQVLGDIMRFLLWRRKHRLMLDEMDGLHSLFSSWLSKEIAVESSEDDKSRGQ